MLVRINRLSKLLTLSLFACVLAHAADDVSSDLTVNHIVTLPDGSETRQAASAAKPGDVLEYVAEYHNGSTRKISHLEATLPIPVGTEYVFNSAAPAEVSASLDGKTFARPPLKRSVRQVDGTLVQEVVPYREYRFLRWPAQDLKAGQTLRVTARARLSTEFSPAVCR